MDKFKKIIFINKKIMVFLFSLSVIALIFGSCLPVFLSNDDKEITHLFLNDFVNNIKVFKDFFILLRNSLVNNCVFLILVWLLGISVIGIPIVLFIFFSKCFILGFSISSIILNYGFKGVIFGLSYVFPCQVINILVYSLITSYSLVFSIKLILLIIKKSEFNIKIAFNKYFKIFIFCLIILAFSSLYESFIEPFILNYVFKLFGI